MTDSPDDYMAWLAGHEAWAERIDQENRGILWTDGHEPDWDATETQRGRRADLGEGFPPIAALRAAERETGSLMGPQLPTIHDLWRAQVASCEASDTEYDQPSAERHQTETAYLARVDREPATEPEAGQ